MNEMKKLNPQPSEARPLVTFALFSYNQEKYIKEAVLSALKQTYEPLEIIISDDFSNDNTYEIIESLARNYSGNSSVIINKNEKNLNIGGHIQAVSKIAKGEIIIMAAGDDISYPDRTTKIVDFLQKNSKIKSVYSNYDIIDDDGKLIEFNHKFWNSTEDVNGFKIVYGGGGIGTGASFAYKRECFEWPYPYPFGINNEDRLLPWRSYLLGGVGYISEPLIKYRYSASGVSRSNSASNIMAAKKKEHILELVKTLNLAYEHNKINKYEFKILNNALMNLENHMYARDYFNDNWGSAGKLISRALRFLFRRYEIYYLLRK